MPLRSGVTKTAVKEKMREVNTKAQLKWGIKNNITEKRKQGTGQQEE